MNVVEIIEKKRDAIPLTAEEINYFIEGYVHGEIPDYQVSAWLMACYLNKLSIEETSYLTEAMIASGERIDLSSVKGIKVDKHSTGGVGDSITLILAPLVAACGLPVVKMSGRGLGHTGGTLDKLLAIDGFDYDLEIEEIIKQANEIGIVLAGQTEDIVPADKLLYSLRDVTGTVNNLSLIASSIMSKKIAMGADIILLDVKVGSGAFMNTIEDARELAKVMVALGEQMNKTVIAFLTDMEQPLGMTIGNAIEIREIIQILRDNVDCDLRTLSIQFAAKLLWLANIVDNEKAAIAMVEEKLKNKEAYQKFKELVIAEKGDVSLIENPEKIPLGAYVQDVVADKNGYIHRCDALSIGKAAFYLGAGREKKEDDIDLGASINIYKKIGDRVEIGDVLATLYTNRQEFMEIASDQLIRAIEIAPEKIKHRPLILEIITKEDII